MITGIITCTYNGQTFHNPGKVSVADHPPRAPSFHFSQARFRIGCGCPTKHSYLVY
jgi:hypothetical protein